MPPRVSFSREADLSVNLLILSRSLRLYSTRRLYLVARAAGHAVTVADPLHCAVVLGLSGPRLLVRGEPAGPVDAVIPRIGRSVNFHGLAVLRQFESGGAWSLNSSRAVASARDKLHQMQLLAQRGIPLVPTAFARKPADVRRAIADLGGPPCVIKFTDGAQGMGVMLAESAAGAESIADAFHNVNQNILLQPFIGAARDLRLFVVGGRVVAAMRRQAREGEFRANLHRGGVAVVHHPTPDQRATAIAATRALGLDAAGVDLLDTPQGPLVLEINASPGLRGIEAASGRNVALAILRFIESRPPRISRGEGPVLPVRKPVERMPLPFPVE